MSLPTLGRGYQTIRILWGVSKISEKVDDTAEFTAGMVATRKLDANGDVVYSVCGASDKPAGIFFNHRNLYFYIPVIKESVTFDVDTKNLNNANIKNGSVIVTNASGSTTYTEGTDYSINYVNGQITRLSGGSISSGDTILVSYKYKDPNESGFDQVGNTGKVTIIKGRGEIATTVYDTKFAINLNDEVKVNADGLLSTDSSLSGDVVGVVTKAPSANDPELIVELK